MQAILHIQPPPERIWAVLIKLIEGQYQYTLEPEIKEETMTFAAYYWAILTAALGITVVGMALAKTLWPWLKRNRWAIGEWDET